MASRIRERKIVDTLGKGRLTHTSGEEEQLRKDVPEWRSPGQKRRRIVGPRREEHKYVVPWAIVE
jgi:hypothetical protein